MRFKHKLAVCIATLVLATSSYAAQLSDAKCPEVSDIKAENLEGFGTRGDGFIAFHRSKYNTDHNWQFQLGSFASSSKEETLEAANLFLQTISGPPTPDWLFDTYVCWYKVSGKLSAVAILEDKF